MSYPLAVQLMLWAIALASAIIGSIAIMRGKRALALTAWIVHLLLPFVVTWIKNDVIEVNIGILRVGHYSGCYTWGCDKTRVTNVLAQDGRTLWDTLAALLIFIVSIAIVVALVAAANARPYIGAAARRAALAQQRQQQQHQQRIAQISAWESAYRDAHGGAAPPPGFMPPATYGAYPGAVAPTNTMAILAIVFGWNVALLGIIFGHIALSQIARTGERGRGMAITGLVFGYLAIGVAVVLWGIVGVAFLSL